VTVTVTARFEPGAAPKPAEPKVTPVKPAPAQPLPTRARGSVENEGSSLYTRVFAGHVYDAATLALPADAVLVVPESAVVAYGAPPKTIELFMDKTLAFMGHPPEAMPAAGVRNNMGCAARRESGTLLVGTYGEWMSIEGGAGLALFVRVPADVHVVARARIAGPDSDASTWPEDAPIARQEAGRIGYWYAATQPAPGWRAIPSRPDNARVARFVEPRPEAARAAREAPVDRSAPIEAVVEAKKADLAPCADARPNLAAASVDWRVLADGRLEGLAMRSMDANTPAFEACVTRTIRAWTFPATGGGATRVSAVFVFGK
jgi:hypothetical protein